MGIICKLYWVWKIREFENTSNINQSKLIICENGSNIMNTRLIFLYLSKTIFKDYLSLV